MIAETLHVREIFGTKLTSLVSFDLSSMNSLVSLEMSSLPELFWALVTLELGFAMIKFVSCKTTFVTEQFGTLITLKSHIFMDSFDMSVEVIFDVVHNITMRTGEVSHLQFPDAMEFCLVLLTILKPSETLSTMFTDMFCLFWLFWSMDNPNVSVQVSLDTPISRANCARKLLGRNPCPLLQLLPVNPFLVFL